MVTPSTRLTQDFTPDKALDLSATYKIGSVDDRRYADNQIIAAQRLMTDGLIRGLVATWFRCAVDIVKGDVLCGAQLPVDDGSGYLVTRTVTLANASALAAAGMAVGVAMNSALAGSWVRCAVLGLVGSSITGLAAGASGLVRVSSVGRCERVAGFTTGDLPIGAVDAAGNLTVQAERAVSAGGGSGGYTTVKNAAGTAQTQRSVLKLPAQIVPSDSGGETALALSGVILANGGTAFAADQPFGAHKATGLANGTTGTQDAATVAQVEALIAGSLSTIFDIKPSVRLATTAALAANTRVSNVLTANANGALATIDGVAPALNDRILVKDEATSANRGIYTVTSLGSGGTPWTMTRAADADTNTEVTPGLACIPEEGTNKGHIFILTTAAPFVVNTSAWTFADVQMVAGDGSTIQLVAGILSVIAGGIGNTELAPGAVTPPKLTIGSALQQVRQNAAGTAVEAFTPDTFALGTDLTDANVTINISQGTVRVMRASTTTTTRAITFGTTGTPEIDEILQVMVYAQGNDVTVVNGGPLGGTLYTVLSGTKRLCEGVWDGVNWAPSFRGRLG